MALVVSLNRFRQGGYAEPFVANRHLDALHLALQAHLQTSAVDNGLELLRAQVQPLLQPIEDSELLGPDQLAKLRSFADPSVRAEFTRPELEDLAIRVGHMSAAIQQVRSPQFQSGEGLPSRRLTKVTGPLRPPVTPPSLPTPAPAAVEDDWRPLEPLLWGARLSVAPRSPDSAHLKDAFLLQPYHDRDVSWLDFNERVLAEAADPSVPPLERLRFCSIVNSNLDEFFMVRVGNLFRMHQRNPHAPLVSGLTPRQLLAQIRERVLRQKARLAAVLRETLSALEAAGIRVVTDFGRDRSLDEAMRAGLNEALIVMRHSDASPPQILGSRLYVFVRFARGYAVIDPGGRERRLVRIVRLEGEGTPASFALLDRWIAARAAEIFAGQEVIEAFPFRVLRDAHLDYPQEEEGSLAEHILKGVHRRRGETRVIRLEVDAPSYSEGAVFLAAQVGLDPAALYRFDLPLDLQPLARLHGLPGADKLRYPPFRPRIPPPFRRGDLFATVRAHDILLHHPYDAFDPVVELLERAARDPAVREIQHTLYRTSRLSPIVEALKLAAANGKRVSAYVEVKARFDEADNVRRAEELQAAGVRVVRPFGRFKVHCKMTRIVRQQDGDKATYVHLGTGNYHPGTALQYTDIGLLTADARIGAETGAYFAALAHRQSPAGYEDLLVAPQNLHDAVLRLIGEETREQQAGGRGRIVAKMNSLVDSDIIQALYQASQAGVRIDLVVRGICCLRPGIGGLSENIRVVSIVDRFLEHSRLYLFGEGDRERLYVSSADWMPRNFFDRYEIAFPVKDPTLRRHLADVVLGGSLADNVKAWDLKPDGSWNRVERPEGAKAVRSQLLFQRLAEQDYRATPLWSRVRLK